MLLTPSVLPIPLRAAASSALRSEAAAQGKVEPQLRTARGRAAPRHERPATPLHGNAAQGGRAGDPLSPAAPPPVRGRAVPAGPGTLPGGTARSPAAARSGATARTQRGAPTRPDSAPRGAPPPDPEPPRACAGPPCLLFGCQGAARRARQGRDVPLPAETLRASAVTQVLPAVPIYGKAAAPSSPRGRWTLGCACGPTAGRFQKGARRSRRHSGWGAVRRPCGAAGRPQRCGVRVVLPVSGQLRP